MNATTGRDEISDLRTLMLASQRFRQAIASRFGLGLREAVVVGHLADASTALTPSQIAQRMLLGSGTLTAVLDRLVAAGYARRRPNPHDRRSSLVVLSRSGHRMVRIINRELEVMIAEAAPGPGEYLVRLATGLNSLADQHPTAARAETSPRARRTAR